MTHSEYLAKAAIERTCAAKAERYGFKHIATGHRAQALKFEKLAILANLGQVEETTKEN